jgi:predicted MFS family arabinose efflux permease
MTDQPGKWDTSYEWKAVLLLGLGFGLVGLDRWIIAPLLPSMAKDLQLNYQDMGNIIGALAFSWGVFAIVLGRLSDGIGRRKVLIPALVVFSLMSGLTGAATGVISILVIRALMGMTEGAYCATSVAAAGEASAPQRRGFNQGLQMSLFPLLGMGLGPILATQLLTVLPSWRWVFAIAAVPGLILALFMGRVIREPAHLKRTAGADKTRWLETLKSGNVIVGMLSLFCAMSCIFVLAGMTPSYLTDYLKLKPQEMGLLMSALGLGGFVGDFGVTALSDYIGRKTAGIISFAGGAVSVYLFAHTGADFWALYGLMFLISVFSFGILAMMTGPVASEAVPVALTASATGLISGTGEIFGGGAAPAISGYIAQHYGIQNVLYVGMGGMCVGLAISLFLKETAPRKVGGAALADGVVEAA